MTHTPSPWGYAPAMQTGLTRPYERFDIFHTTPPNHDNSYGIDTGSRKVFLGVIRAQPSKVTTEANARLMASSPKMLAILQKVIEASKAGDFYDRGRKTHDLIPEIQDLINQLEA